MNTVARLMAVFGLVARVGKRRRGLTKQGSGRPAPDCVRRDFTAEEPDLAWAGDMTEIATWIADFYHTRRLHSICRFKSPIDYEHAYRTGLTVELAA